MRRTSFGDVAWRPVTREGWKLTPKMEPCSRKRDDIRTEGGGGMIGEAGAGVGSCGAVGGPVWEECWPEVRGRWGRATTDEEETRREVEMPMRTREVKWQNSDWRRTNSGHAHSRGCARVGTLEARVKRVKHVGNEKEASEDVSNDAVVAS